MKENLPPPVESTPNNFKNLQKEFQDLQKQYSERYLGVPKTKPTKAKK